MILPDKHQIQEELNQIAAGSSFTKKLYDIVNQKCYSHIICWCPGVMAV